MAQIIQFPTKEAMASNGYSNLSGLIAIATSNEAVESYISVADLMQKVGYLHDGDLEKLTEQAREKRLEMAKPELAEKEAVEAPGVYRYTPEMGGQKPDCQMEASRGYYGKHWYIDTPLEIKGRGIEFVKKYQEKDFCKPGNYRVGWNSYRVTNRAFEKLKEKYSISLECLLD